MPFADDEIGALCYRGDGLGYVVVNTSLPRVNVNFAIAHEIYHVFSEKANLFQKLSLQMIIIMSMRKNMRLTFLQECC